MKRHKLRSERGETLVEVLASVLIVSLSVMMVVGSVMASSNVDVKTEELDKKYYDALTNAETHGGEKVKTGVKIEIKNEKNNKTATLDFDLYGGAGMYSYERAGS